MCLFSKIEWNFVAASCHACTGVCIGIDRCERRRCSQTQKKHWSGRLASQSINSAECKMHYSIAVVCEPLVDDTYSFHSPKLRPIQCWQKRERPPQWFGHKHIWAAHTGMPTHCSQRTLQNNLYDFSLELERIINCSICWRMVTHWTAGDNLLADFFLFVFFLFFFSFGSAVVLCARHAPSFGRIHTYCLR